MDNDGDPPLSLIMKSTDTTPTPTHSAPTSRSRPPPKFHRFLNLPLEIRRMIYGIAIARHNPIVTLCSNSGFGLGPKEPHGEIVDVSLFATGKAIHDEAKAEFLLRITIRLNDINVCKLDTTEGQRGTIRDARHLIVLFQPKQHRTFYKDVRVLDFEFPRFRCLETFHLVLYHAVEPRPNKNTHQQIGMDLNEWTKIWIKKKATIEWRDVSVGRGLSQTPEYLKKKEEFAEYLSHVERCMVKGQHPE